MSAAHSLAMVFPGQGSQAVGMLADLAEQSPEVRATFDEASAALGYDLWQRVQDGPAEALNKTECTQPALLAAGIAVWRVWQARGGAQPAFMAGHSLGEYTALVAAGALDFAAAIKLVEFRGQAMQAAVPAGEGAMAAILGLADDEVAAACEAAAESSLGNNEIVSPVNFNSPGQVVIAGNAQAVERAMKLCKEKGAKRAMALPVSVPSHCELMRPAAEQMALRLQDTEIQPPAIPVLHNVDVAAHELPDDIRQALVAQLHSPVRWVETVQALHEKGITTLVEAGPGKVLAGLNRRIVKDMAALPVYDTASLEKALEQ